MPERYGYEPFRRALDWMKKNRGRDVTTNIGGIMGPGIHKAIVQEKIDGGNTVDFIFQSTDRLLHKERTWGKGRLRYKLDTVYEFELMYGGDGTHRIEATNGTYNLIALRSGQPVFAAESIRQVYQYVNENKFKLVYLRIKWSREIKNDM